MEKLFTKDDLPMTKYRKWYSTYHRGYQKKKKKNPIRNHFTLIRKNNLKN